MQTLHLHLRRDHSSSKQVVVYTFFENTVNAWNSSTMEHGDLGRHEWQRDPNSVALACAVCHSLITPCIICARPIPFIDGLIWVECSYCGAVNPMSELERRLLGLSRPLALTSSMVRRVMVAHVGRRQYTTALQFQFQMTHDMTICSDQIKDGSSQQKLDHTDMDIKLTPHKTLYDLPFVEYDGMVTQLVESTELSLVESKDTSEGEPLPKRIRLTSENEDLDRHRRGHSKSEESCMQKPNQLAEIRKSMHGDITLSRAGIHKSSEKQVSDEEDTLNDMDLGRGNKKYKVAHGSTHCSNCGSCVTKTGKDSLTAQGSFIRMEGQLLALHSAESLSSDLHSSTYTYPICGSVHVSAIKVAGAKTCVSQYISICGSRQQFSHFSINIIHLAHSVLASEWKKWLVHHKLNIKEQLIDEVLKCAELFLQKRQAIFHAQGMMWKAMAAQEQSKLDSRAFSEHQLYISAGSLLKDIFKERVQERRNTFKELVKPFRKLLDQINVLLKFCFEVLRGLLKDASLCRLECMLDKKFDGTYSESTRTLCQAIQSALPLWLLLYHDVAHATILGQLNSPTNK